MKAYLYMLGGGGGTPLKVQARPPRDQRLAIQCRVSVGKGRTEANFETVEKHQ